MKKTLIIVVGPSGAGKSSFVSQIIGEMDLLVDTTTYTTRDMRAGESEGNPYHFVPREKFEELIKEDFFIEWAEVHGNLYGTPHYQISEAWDSDRVIIMDVDVQGAKTFKKKYPQSFTLFIMPPSIEELRQRVSKRDGSTVQDLELRMVNAKKEIAMAEEFDAQLINDDFESSYKKFKKMIEEFLQKP